MSKKLRKSRRRELNKKNFPSEAWFEKLLNEHSITRYTRNWCIDRRFFGDFVWIANKLVVEIDGSSHDGKEDYDRMRDKRMESLGYTVKRIRFGDRKEATEVIKFLKHKLKPSCLKAREPRSNPRKLKKQDISKMVKEKNEAFNKMLATKKILNKAIATAKLMSKEKGNKFLELKLKELNLTPQQAKALL